MKTNVASLNWNALGSSTLGIVAVLFVIAFFMGWKVPMISDDRAAFIALAVIGFAMCSIGMGKIATGLGWTHPISIVGIVLGALVILLVIAMLAGWQVPFIADYRAAFVAVAVVGLVKWALAWASRLFPKVRDALP
jgi:hypothetical protein